MKCRNIDGTECGNNRTSYKDGYCHRHRDQVPFHGMVIKDETFTHNQLPMSNTDGLEQVRRIKAQLEGG